MLNSTKDLAKYLKLTLTEIEMLELAVSVERSDALIEHLDAEIKKIRTNYNELDGVSAPKGGEL